MKHKEHEKTAGQQQCCGEVRWVFSGNKLELTRLESVTFTTMLTRPQGETRKEVRNKIVQQSATHCSSCWLWESYVSTNVQTHHRDLSLLKIVLFKSEITVFSLAVDEFFNRRAIVGLLRVVSSDLVI
ncbi:hypothetical protein TNCV_4780781 [Trichonephila clavipes]|nr:hypothetical protein TNCV_4780781 [Trichonephila clavipes]